MKAPVILKTFNHAIFPTTAGNTATLKSVRHQHHKALLTAEIDFEKGAFSLEGDWQFIMGCNKQAEPEWFTVHDNRVTIDASICPGSSIDLADDNNDGAVFILEGTVEDSDNLIACSGLLVLDKVTADNTMAANNWNISFYLYENEDCEIALKIPVLVCPAKTRVLN